MPVLTVKVKAKQYPLWHYAVATVLAIVGTSFWAWMAYLAGFGWSAVRQVLFVFGGAQLLLIPSLYFANERRFHNHNSKAVQWVAAGFIGLIVLRSFTGLRFTISEAGEIQPRRY